MEFDFSRNAPQSVNEDPGHFLQIISFSLTCFINRYTPYLGNAMTQIVSRFTNNPIINFGSLVAGVSRELCRIKEATKGKRKHPLADVKGVCSFQLLLIAVATLLTPKDLSTGR